MSKLDNAVNFGKVTVLNPYGSGNTSIVLQAGQGALLPTAPFNVVWWNSAVYSDPSDDPNVEIVRVTAGGGGGGGDTLTVTRGQEGTAATAKNTAGGIYKMAAAFTAKVPNTDLYNAFDGGGFHGRMPNPSWPKAYVNNTVNGNNDVYTVPTGRIAVVFGLTVANFGANNPNYYVQFKTGGTYYQWTTAAAVGASPSNAANVFVGMICLLQGEILSLHADATGMSAWFNVIEFDSATTDITRGLITSLSNGSNTLHTVASGKTARIMPQMFAASAVNVGSGGVQVFNASGGAITLIFYAVPSGGSTGVTNEFWTAAPGNLVNTNAFLPGNLTAGDFIVVNTSTGTATQTAMVVLIEQ